METFVVRIWVPGDADRGPAAGEVVRGFVEHAPTGAVTRFAGGEQLLAALTDFLPPGDAQAVSDDGKALGSTPTSIIRAT